MQQVVFGPEPFLRHFGDELRNLQKVFHVRFIIGDVICETNILIEFVRISCFWIVSEKEHKSHHLFAGMPRHSDDQDVDMHAGTAEHPGSLSFSTSTAREEKKSEESDVESVACGSEESRDSSIDIFPAGRYDFS